MYSSNFCFGGYFPICLSNNVAAVFQQLTSKVYDNGRYLKCIEDTDQMAVLIFNFNP